MSSEAHRAGITPYVLKLSAYYAQLGVGTYRPRGYHFDRVEVRVEKPFEMSADGLLSHSFSLIRVEFWSGQVLERYVDFALAVAGFSGKPLLSTVK